MAKDAVMWSCYKGPALGWFLTLLAVAWVSMGMINHPKFSGKWRTQQLGYWLVIFGSPGTHDHSVYTYVSECGLFKHNFDTLDDLRELYSPVLRDYASLNHMQLSHCENMLLQIHFLWHLASKPGTDKPPWDYLQTKVINDKTYDLRYPKKTI